MLSITVPEQTLFDESTYEFKYINETTLRLEHCLRSVRLWESKFNKDFISDIPKTRDEVVEYVRCMTLDENVNSNVYFALTETNLDEIDKYIALPMTATTIKKSKNVKAKQKRITAEVIYGWMFALNIPLELENWHLNQLITQIEVCSAQSKGPEKMSKKDTAARHRSLNAARRKKRR